MRFNLPTFIQTLLLATPTSASVAHVYLSSPDASPKPTSSNLSPNTARLVFAQRLGVAQYHKLGDADEETIAGINNFGGGRQSLFSGDDDQDRIRVLVLVDGVERPEDVISTSTNTSASFMIDNVPDYKSSEKLLQDLEKQASSILGQENLVENSRLNDFWTASPLSQMQMPFSMLSAGCRGVANLAALETVSSTHGLPSPEYVAASDATRQTIDKLFAKSASEDWDVTVILMPRRSGGSIFKRAQASSWGKYSMPSKRQLEDPALTAAEMSTADYIADEPTDAQTNLDAITVERPSTLQAPVDEQVVDIMQPTTEQSIDSVAEEAAHGATDSTSNDHSWFNVLDDAFDDLEESIESTWDSWTGSNSTSSFTTTQQDTSPPRGILPACYSSLSDCISTTHNCSGHGSCYRKFGDAATNTVCFTCGCKATRYDVEGGGQQVTNWAGPACQKVDVSVPFWIIGSSVIGLLGAAAWGVGILYTMGSQELPSVLSAGVAPGKRQ